MPKEPIMLVSLREDKAKKLAQVMSNPSCTRILEYLAGKDATVTVIAKDLKMPLSTVHYNIQQLVDAKLVIAEEFHYSEKGREVNHYKLANKYIIIAPQDDDPTLLERLKKFVPITVITLGLAAVLKTMQFFTGTLAAGSKSADLMALRAMPEALPAAAPLAEPMMKTIADTGVQTTAEQVADSAAGAAAPEGARMMVASDQALNTVLNETANETVTEIAGDTAQNIAFAPPLDVGSQQSMPWWQSHAIDYFIPGALFVLFVFVIAETIAYMRAKRGKN